MHATDDFIDEIDALIGEQLDAGEPMNGYDFDDPDFPTCWHCGRDWHGLAITERMNEMRSRGVVDEDYRYADDESPVICPGSDFIGPVQRPPRTLVRGPVLGLVMHTAQPNGSYQLSVNQMQRFVEHVRQMRMADLGIWQLPEAWYFPRADPVAEAAATLPDVRDLQAEGWRPLGYVPEGFTFELSEPEPDPDESEHRRAHADARACAHSIEEPEVTAPLSLPPNPSARRPSRPPFWAARMDGRR